MYATLTLQNCCHFFSLEVEYLACPSFDFVVVVVVSPLAELSLVYVGLSGILFVVKTLRYI